MEYEALEIQEGLVYKEVPINIMDRKEQEIRTKMIPLVKVLWHNHIVEEA